MELGRYLESRASPIYYAVLYTKLILHLIFFGANYTSGAGPVWDYMTIQLARLAGNPVKMNNAGIA